MAETVTVFRRRSKAQLFLMAQSFLLLASAYFVRDSELLIIVQAGIQLVLMLTYQVVAGGQPQDPEAS